MSYVVVRFNYRKLQRDLGYLVADMPMLLESVFGETISKAAVYAWFGKGRMPVDRLIQVLTIARIETDQRLDIWSYIEAVEPKSRSQAKRYASQSNRRAA